MNKRERKERTNGRRKRKKKTEGENGRRKRKDRMRERSGRRELKKKMGGSSGDRYGKVQGVRILLIHRERKLNLVRRRVKSGREARLKGNFP